jgi:TRAP-type C4-dicarboxylate transport system substrate-binding protein
MTVRRAGCGALVAVGLAAAATACGGSGDKAGGVGAGPAVVLTLESEDDPQLTPAPEFAAAVERLSGGSVRIRLVPAGRGLEVDFERGVVEDVRAGKTQLGLVGARVWDTMGVPSFRPLLAPFLVDSLELEGRALERPEAERMLDGVEQSGVVGVGLLPGPLRHPSGISGPLRGPADFHGATIGIRPGRMAREALQALGASTRSPLPGDLGGLDGVEIDPATIAYNDYDHQVVTGNVVLWPKPFTIVMNRSAWQGLSTELWDLLRRAAREAGSAELRQVQQDETTAVDELCRRGQASFVSATAAEVAALRGAVRPVYAELERDADAGRLVAWIDEHREAVQPLRCRRTSSTSAAGSSSIEGRWETTWTSDDLVAAGIRPRDAAVLSGHHTADFHDGRFRFAGDPGSGKSATGTYVLDGDVVRLTFETGFALQLGRVYELGWNVYRDSLTFTAVPGSEPLLAFLTAPYRRVR